MSAGPFAGQAIGGHALIRRDAAGHGPGRAIHNSARNCGMFAVIEFRRARFATLDIMARSAGVFENEKCLREAITDARHGDARLLVGQPFDVAGFGKIVRGEKLVADVANGKVVAGAGLQAIGIDRDDTIRLWRRSTEERAHNGRDYRLICRVVPVLGKVVIASPSFLPRDTGATA